AWLPRSAVHVGGGKPVPVGCPAAPRVAQVVAGGEVPGHLLVKPWAVRLPLAGELEPRERGWIVRRPPGGGCIARDEVELMARIAVGLALPNDARHRRASLPYRIKTVRRSTKERRLFRARIVHLARRYIRCYRERVPWGVVTERVAGKRRPDAEGALAHTQRDKQCSLWSPLRGVHP